MLMIQLGQILTQHSSTPNIIMQPLSDSDSSFQEIIAEQDIPIRSSLTSSTAMAAQKVKTLLTNSMFVLEGYTSKLSSMILDSKPSPDIDYYILGQKLPDRAAAQAKFKRTIWFTYRNNFPGLLNNSQVSDTGWGCMIRVGQMFLAEMLRRYQSHNYKGESISNILTAFLDDDESKKDSINYSIQKIVRIGHQEFKLQPGTWLTPSHISYILDQIHNNMPLRGYENQKIMVFNNNTIFYQQILNEMGYKICKCHKIKLKCDVCHQPSPNNTSLVVILLSRVGLDNPQEQYRRIVMDLLQFKQSIGIIGGKPNKALYFIGRQGLDKFIYLDPHYVQQSTTRKNMQSLKETFFCNSYRTIQYKNIDPSLGFGFYLHDLDDLADFFGNLMRVSKYYEEDFFIYAEMKIPYYVKRELVEEKKESDRKKLKISSIFQVEEKYEKTFQI